MEGEQGREGTGWHFPRLRAPRVLGRRCRSRPGSGGWCCQAAAPWQGRTPGNSGSRGDKPPAQPQRSFGNLPCWEPEAPLPARARGFGGEAPRRGNRGSFPRCHPLGTPRPVTPPQGTRGRGRARPAGAATGRAGTGTTASAAPPGPQPCRHAALRRTILSPDACAPPPSAAGRPGRGGGEGPARCASGGRAKNNCGVLATAFPLAGGARRRLRIGALPQPVSRRGCARGGGAGRGAGAAGSCSRRGGRGLPRLDRPGPAPRGVRGLRENPDARRGLRAALGKGSGGDEHPRGHHLGQAPLAKGCPRVRQLLVRVTLRTSRRDTEIGASRLSQECSSALAQADQGGRTSLGDQRATAAPVAAGAACPVREVSCCLGPEEFPRKIP